MSILSTNDLLAKADLLQPDNTTQLISPSDTRTNNKDVAESSVNKITDAHLLGLKDYSTIISYEAGSYVGYDSGSGFQTWRSNKLTSGTWTPVDWDLVDGGAAGSTVSLGASVNGLILSASNPQILQLQAASGSLTGALTTTDWNTFNNKQAALGFTAEDSANKGIANGYVPLNATSKIDVSYMPSGIVGAVIYKGTWNPNTNVPVLADGTGTQGDYYVVNTYGSIDLGSGSVTYNVQDWVIHNGTTWDKLTNSSSATIVASVVVNDSAVSGATVKDALDWIDANTLSYINQNVSTYEFNTTSGGNDSLLTISTTNVVLQADSVNGFSASSSSGVGIVANDGSLDLTTSNAQDILISSANELELDSSGGTNLLYDGGAASIYLDSFGVFIENGNTGAAISIGADFELLNYSGALNITNSASTATTISNQSTGDIDVTVVTGDINLSTDGSSLSLDHLTGVTITDTNASGGARYGGDYSGDVDWNLDDEVIPSVKTIRENTGAGGVGEKPVSVEITSGLWVDNGDGRYRYDISHAFNTKSLLIKTYNPATGTESDPLDIERTTNNNIRVWADNNTEEFVVTFSNGGLTLSGFIQGGEKTADYTIDAEDAGLLYEFNALTSADITVNSDSLEDGQIVAITWTGGVQPMFIEGTGTIDNDPYTSAKPRAINGTIFLTRRGTVYETLGKTE